MEDLYKDMLYQLPGCLIYKATDAETIYFSQACKQHLGLSQTSYPSRAACPLLFYDSHSGGALTYKHCPLEVATSFNNICQRITLQTGNYRFDCQVQSKLINFGFRQWLVMQLTLNQLPSCKPLGMNEDSTSFSMMLSAISTRLINVKDNEVHSLIEQSLGTFGDYFSAQRCYIFRFSTDKMFMDNSHEWVAAGVTPFKEELHHVPLKQLPYFANMIKREHVFIVNDVTQLPAAAWREREEFIREGIRAVLCVAVHVNDELFGFIGCDCLSATRTWTQHEIKSMRLIGEMVSETLASISTRRALEKVQQALIEANQRLETLVNLDGLTHIANRRYFDSYLLTLWEQSCQSQTPLSLLLIDVDHFKYYNDTYGHQAGDMALKVIAGALDRIATMHDGLSARYGGEEFAVILPATSQHSASDIARNILQAIRELNIPYSAAPDNDRITVSIGVTDNKYATDFPMLISHADKALYEAKQAGRDQWAFCPLQDTLGENGKNSRGAYG
ncbi:GGDEF domain-containing protein [Salinimonas chungwhensis]|uniref:GGDEF domain-containing protein n=1 Tax=Salinimonas chungwhensis TaxID=265425 RepID=UPI000365145D|nr:sensor domain-containing diguanylate cyclase [Salinimonas chungwhensis]